MLRWGLDDGEPSGVEAASKQRKVKRLVMGIVKQLVKQPVIQLVKQPVKQLVKQLVSSVK